MTRERVAILGGGIAGLTTAFELTATPELRERFDVTVYQHGWRLGGKCASGRNAAFGNRIEEHGLHLWFGLYENAFALMRQCYAELGRPAGTPLATVDDALQPHHHGVLWDDYRGTWVPFDMRFDPDPRQPGDGTPLPGFWDIARRGIEFHWEEWQRWRHGGIAPSPTHHGHLSHWVHAVAHAIGKVLDPVTHASEDAMLDVARALANHHCKHHGSPDEPEHRGLLARLLGGFRAWVWKHFAATRLDNDEFRLWITRMDLELTMLIGIVADAVHDHGFEQLDEIELRAWLARHGASDVTLQGAMVRAWYSGAFAFLGGDTDDPAHANVAAGTSVANMLRQELGYKGAVIYRMTAGMGDAVVAPLYQALVARGVTFRFFHRVTGIRSDAPGGATIDRIDLHQQVQSPGGYAPLIEVRGLPCWPSEPRWEQLEGGEALRAAGVNLELSDGPAPFPISLRRGIDFDKVVLAISIAALPPICADLLADPSKPRFAAMIEHSSTCMTQAFQVWMNRDLNDTPGRADGLGWEHGSNISSTYVEPIDTYCDMTQLVDAEAWPPEAGVKSIGYFCGVLPDLPGDTQESTTQRARDSAVAFLRDHSGVLWPNAVASGSFDFDLLVDPQGGTGAERFDRQYWRANFPLTERYVLSPAGSIKHRIAAGDGEWDNMVFAGDWTKTGLDLGCVEATVMSGMQAARALSGIERRIPGEDHSWLVGHEH